MQARATLKLLPSSSDMWVYCYIAFPRLQAMRSARIVHGALLLLAAVTSANSAKCSRLIDGVTTPRSYAEGRYNFFMTLYNMTEQVYAYMPNTRYSGKYTIAKGKLYVVPANSIFRVPVHGKIKASVARYDSIILNSFEGLCLVSFAHTIPRRDRFR